MDIKSSEKYPILFFEKFISEININREFNKFESDILDNYQVISYSNFILEVYCNDFGSIDLKIEFENHLRNLLYLEFEKSKEIIDKIAIDKIDSENRNASVFINVIELSVINRIQLIAENQADILAKYPILKTPLLSIINYINSQYSIYLKKELNIPVSFVSDNFNSDFQSNTELIDLVFGNLKNKFIEGIRVINENDYNSFKENLLAFLENKEFIPNKILIKVLLKSQINYLFGIFYKHNRHIIKPKKLGEFAFKVLENYSNIQEVDYLRKHLTDKPDKIDSTIFSPYVIDYHRKN